VRRTHTPRGQTPVFKEHFNWKRLSAIGAVAWRPWQASTQLLLSVRPGNISTPEGIEFLRNLRRHIPGPVVVLWDGLPWHCSGETKKSTSSHKRTGRRWSASPAYAPELNPLEYLRAALKSKDIANYSPDTIAELDDQLLHAMRRVRCRDIGLSFIKKAGGISKDEYLHLRRDR